MDGPGDHAEYEANDPHTQSHHGHFWVVDVGYGRADFWERTVLFVDRVKVKLHPGCNCEGRRGG